MTDLDIRIPDPDDTYTIRIAPGYVSITDHNKPKVDKQKRTVTEPKKTPSAPSRSKFTPLSRRSLQKALNEVRLHKRPTHYIVLTQPSASMNAKDWKRGISNLRRRVVNNFPHCWFFWRLMPEKQRGVPVLHLLGSLADNMDVKEVQEKFAGWWSKLNDLHWTEQPKAVRVQEVTPPHDKLFRKMCNAEPATHHTSYHEAWGKLGKRWDVWNGKNIPYDVVEEFTIKHDCHHEIKRVLMGSVEEDIKEIETRMSGQVDSHEFSMLRDSLHGKRQFLDKLSAMDDNLLYLDKEHIDFIREILSEYSE